MYIYIIIYIHVCNVQNRECQLLTANLDLSRSLHLFPALAPVELLAHDLCYPGNGLLGSLHVEERQPRPPSQYIHQCAGVLLHSVLHFSFYVGELID